MYIKIKKYHYDFYLPLYDVLVEIDGCYWHGKNIKDDELNVSQLKTRKNDIKKNKTCFSMGKKLIRIWEDELTKENIINKLKIDQ